MSDKTVQVTLKARIAEYQKAMRDAAKETKNLGESGSIDMKKLGGQMVNVGQKMTMGVTLPVIGAGVAAVGMSNNFNSAFGQMVGLAGVSASEVDGLKESVLGLAGRAAKSPQELAEALYFLRSSGLGADEAMAALEISAKASAAGLGNTATIADAVSSAMNAYAKSGLSAAEATDVLVATARAGKAEPEQLASALGRILPIASELGVTFEDVGGAIASLSLSGNDAATSSTLLSNILSKMLKPSQQGAEALAAVGMSTDSIRQSIADNGLLATLELLKDRLGDAGFVKFMEDAQAVQGALALTGQNAETVRGVFDQVADSAGATGEAFAAVDEDSQAMKQAWVDIQIALIQVGDTIAPIVADIAGGIGDLAGAFTELDPTIQSVVIGIAGLAAAAGPALIAVGSLVRNYKELKTVMSGSSFAAAAGPLGILTVALGATVIAWSQAKTQADKVTAAMEAQETAAEGLVEAMLAAGDPVLAIAASLQTAAIDSSVLTDAMLDLGLSFEDAATLAAESHGNYIRLERSLLDSAEAGGATAEELDELKNILASTLGVAAAATGRWEDMTAVQGENADATGEQTEATEAQVAASESLIGVFTAEQVALAALTGGFGEATEGVMAATEAAEEAEAQFVALEAAYDQLNRTLSDRAGYLDVQEELENTAAAVAKLYEDFHNGTITQAELNRELERTLIADQQAVLEYAEEIGNIPPEVATDILALIDQGKYDEAMLMLAELERTRTMQLNIRTNATSALLGAIVGAAGRAAGGPTVAGSAYEVLEGGKSELLTENGRHYLMSANNGHVTPITAAGGGAMGGGGSVTVIDRGQTHHHYHEWKTAMDMDQVISTLDRRARGAA